MKYSSLKKLFVKNELDIRPGILFDGEVILNIDSWVSANDMQQVGENSTRIF